MITRAANLPRVHGDRRDVAEVHPISPSSSLPWLDAAPRMNREPPQSLPPLQPPPPAKPGGMPVKAVPVKVDTVLSEVSAVGSMLAAESVVIRPEVAGRVTELPFKEGQTVQKGAKLLTIDSTELEAALTGSRARLKTEQVKLDRARDLLKQNYISQEAVDNAIGAVSVANAKVREDEAKLAKTMIYAPFSGIVGLRLISPGAYVKAGDDIVRLENMNSLKLDFRVPEMYVSKLKTQQAVTVRTDAFRIRYSRATSTRSSPPSTRRPARWSCGRRSPTSRASCAPACSRRVNVLLETRPNAVIVPEQAIWPQGRDTFVYKVVDGKAVLTKIEIGNRRPGEVEVVEGPGSRPIWSSPTAR